MNGRDLGPSIRRTRGDVVVGWREDSMPPAVLHAARVRDTLREMHVAGRIGDAQWWAAERYRDDAMLVSNQGMGALRLLPSGNGGGGARWLPGDAVLAARQRIRLVETRLSPPQRDCATMFVLGGASLAQSARYARCAKARMSAILRDVLDVLVEFYGRR